MFLFFGHRLIIYVLFTFMVQADFIEELLRGRLVEQGLTPAMLTAYHWQVFIHFLLLFAC